MAGVLCAHGNRRQQRGHRPRTYLCGWEVREDIQETAFSREVRRLGIAIPDGRHWRSVSGRYGNLVNDCNLIMWFLDRFKVPDTERSAVLVETLTALQGGDMIELSYLESQLGKTLVPLPWEAEEQPDTPGDEVAD